MLDRRGSLLATIGGVLGLAAGLFLGGLRAIGGPPSGWLDQPGEPYTGLPPGLLEQAPGNAAFALILIFPYIVALIAARRVSRFRAPLLLAAAVLSFVSMGISLAGAGIVFLPAVVLLVVAASASVKAAGWHGRRTMLPLVLSVVAAVVAGLSSTSLFVHQDPRCWEWVKYDGRTEWRSIPVPEGSFQGQSGASGSAAGVLPPGATSSGSECTSDIITGWEALASLGILAAAAGVLVTAGWYGGRGSAPPSSQDGGPASAG